VTRRSRRSGNCHWARSSRDAGRARRDGSVAGVECKSRFRQTWEWLGERLRKCACNVGLTLLGLLTLIAPTAASVVPGSRQSLNELLHWSERTEPSARSRSVLEHYATLTWVAFDFAIVVVGRCTLSTPSRNSAVTFVLSASSGSVKVRRKVP
jgi:hypothetical protein